MYKEEAAAMEAIIHTSSLQDTVPPTGSIERPSIMEMYCALCNSPFRAPGRTRTGPNDPDPHNYGDKPSRELYDGRVISHKQMEWLSNIRGLGRDTGSSNHLIRAQRSSESYLTTIGTLDGESFAFPATSEHRHLVRKGELCVIEPNRLSEHTDGFTIMIHASCWDLMEIARRHVLKEFGLPGGLDLDTIYEVLEHNISGEGCSFPHNFFNPSGRTTGPGKEWCAADPMDDPLFAHALPRLTRNSHFHRINLPPNHTRPFKRRPNYLDALPLELLYIIVRLLPGPAIDALYTAFPSTKRAELSGSFWRSRIKLDLPYVRESLDQTNPATKDKIDWHSVFRFLSTPEFSANTAFIGFHNRIRIWKVAMGVARRAARMQALWVQRNIWIDRSVLKNALFRQSAHISTCDRPGKPIKCRSFFVQHPQSMHVNVIRIFWTAYPGYSKEEVKTGRTGAIPSRRHVPGKQPQVSIICGFEIAAVGGPALVGLRSPMFNDITVGGVLRGVVLNITKRCLDVDTEEKCGRDALTGIWFMTDGRPLQVVGNWTGCKQVLRPLGGRDLVGFNLIYSEHWGAIHSLGIIEAGLRSNSTSADGPTPSFNRIQWAGKPPPENLVYYGRDFSTPYKRCGNGRITPVHAAVSSILFDEKDPLSSIRVWFRPRSVWRDERIGPFRSPNVCGLEFVNASGAKVTVGSCGGPHKSYKNISLAWQAGEKIAGFEIQYLMPKYMECYRYLVPTVESYIGGPWDDHPSLFLSFSVSTTLGKTHNVDKIDESERSSWWLCRRVMVPRGGDTMVGLQVTVGEELSAGFGLICKRRK
ncbi:hypothetical protein BOTBODRAFT_191048 [Botryobasidium botryosum FD-172 SS1]|uniref:F-box domain-containing protein n=1 Tax=Botryobasidium botryosum (strain FD-172 SS1) TaxID=930990 RepID=A0A067MDB5_BOTB1|nr:hypothetical protein BOTBODRAFT_191048 [Botryobasidium botryosum FD-172 SS1]